MTDEQQSSFNGWARVEVMGHQSHIGFVRTEAYGAAVLFRVDTPELPEREYVLTESQYAQEGESPNLTRWTPAGSKVKRLATPGVTVLIGAGSIYRIIPCTEAAAMKAIEETARSPLKLLELPPERVLAAGSSEPEGEGSDDDEDLCPTCGKDDNHCFC